MNCPHCKVDLTGPPIPANRIVGCGGRTHFDRRICVEVRGLYDGGLYYQCPDCRGRWHRWPPGHRLHALAAPYVEKGQ